jgi:hypothetical protein
MYQTRPHCVNQMEKTHSKTLAARHGRGTAWARHAMYESAFTLTVVFPCFFLSCKAKCQAKNSQRWGTARTLPHYLLFGLFGCYLCCSVYCLCVNVYCHRVTTQLQSINVLFSLCLVRQESRFSWHTDGSSELGSMESALESGLRRWVSKDVD